MADMQVSEIIKKMVAYNLGTETSEEDVSIPRHTFSNGHKTFSDSEEEDTQG